ncbi:NACHT domain-containing protein [Streptomyces sp. NPDC007983]|uniref:NACHT domain-containing protein n=1 Tax=Streptomyces sp. NPDC007983 TaxID=3364800 RepID=UPI0036ECC06A
MKTATDRMWEIGSAVPPGPAPAGRLRRFHSRASWPLVAAWRTHRSRWLLDRGVRKPRRWSRPRTWPWPVLVGALVLFYLLWVVHSVWSGAPWRSAFPQENQAVQAIGTSSTAVIVVAWFVFWRLGRVRRHYLRKAKRHPSKLVKPGSIIGRVVGRDPLCDALMTDLRDRDRRRPHVIVGTIGVGKTALLVRLTERLARKGAIPVVIQLRDVQEVEETADVRNKLNFSELAQQRFLEEVSDKTHSPAEGEKIWQRLRYQQDRVVVLADGLEEALREHAARENLIRQAIAGACEEKLPLVITSRPNDSLEAVQAALTTLEPLSEEAALSYVSSASQWRSDKQRLDWVVEAANVAGSPLYLEIARELETLGRLAPIVAGGDDPSDTRDQDEWALRYDLLEAWIDALVDGALSPEQPISHLGRRMTVEHLSALACTALSQSSAEAAYASLAEHPEGNGDVMDAEALSRIRQHLTGRIKDENGKIARIDVRTAGSWGSRLGLVDDRGKGVRFRHSVMQAYLASLYMRPLLEQSAEMGPEGSEYFREALRRPGREISTALVLFPRSLESMCTCEDTPERCTIRHARNLLIAEAERALAQGTKAESEEQDLRIKALEMYSAALDVDSFDDCPRHRPIVKQIRNQWTKVQEYNERKLDYAKASLVKRIGATARLWAGRVTDPTETPPTAYDLLFQLAGDERSHSVRFTIAREIGEGGDTAFDAVKGELTPPAPGGSCPRHTSESDDRPGPHGDTEKQSSDDGTTRTERLRRKQRANRIRKGRREERRCEDKERETEEKQHREEIMRAWLSPMLVQSCSLSHHEDTPYSALCQWMQAVKEKRLDRGPEVALAQGFKQAANHRTPSSPADDARDFLNEEAWEMLKETHFWFTRLTLLHALTLWALPDNVGQRQPLHGHGSDPGAQVRHWLQHHDGDGGRTRMRHEHPLVRAAARMARQALETRHPDRFLWIDEADVASQIGSETSSLTEPRAHNLWIPPSTGWSTLDPAAQQLLADVLVLAVLAEERGDREEDLQRRLARVDRADPPLLPPCMTESREPLDPMRTPVGESPHSPPGSTCADGCLFKLCPYPPKGPECRMELNELFCINQRALLNFVQLRSWLYLRFRRRAAWQRGTSVPDLRRFWDQMGGRARDRARDEVPGRHLRSSR